MSETRRFNWKKDMENLLRWKRQIERGQTGLTNGSASVIAEIYITQPQEI